VKNITEDLIDRITEEFPGVFYHCTDNTFGHRSYKWERLGRVIFKFNVRKQIFYLRDAKFPQKSKYINMGRVTRIEDLRNLIETAINNHNKRELYKEDYRLSATIIAAFKDICGMPNDFTNPKIPYDFA